MEVRFVYLRLDFQETVTDITMTCCGVCFAYLDNQMDGDADRGQHEVSVIEKVDVTYLTLIKIKCEI